MADSDQDWSIRCVACGQWYLPPGLDDSGFPQGDHGCSKPGGDASRDGLTIKEVVTEMRSAVLGFGLAVVAVVFGLAAANPPVDSSVVVVQSVARSQGPPECTAPISRGKLYRTWIGEACTVSGSAKTSSSVSSSAAPCANGATLTVSGVVSGVMTGTGPWTFSALVPGSGSGMCAYFITVTCTDGVLTAEGALTGNALIECAFPAYGAVDIVSHDPIMIEINFPALAVGCGCAGGTVTISE